jgi:hypothetical protein
MLCGTGLQGIYQATIQQRKFMSIISAAFSALIAESKGKFVTVVFKKKDGQLRKMNCRLGVKKHLKGGLSTVDHSKYLVVYDMQNAGYRCINRDTIVSVALSGEAASLR